MRRAFFLVIALLVGGCEGQNIETATYATLAEAQPAVDRGLVPKGLPASAYEMRAAYDPEGSQRWGIINFPESAAGDLRGLLQPDEISLTGIRCAIPPRIEWWPVQLRQKLDDERIKATGAKAYRAKSDGLVFIVNWAQGRAYYFTPQ